MVVLTADTSTPFGSVSLFNHGEISELSWTNESSHSEWVTLKSQELLRTNSLELRDLTALAVGIGPGSFTGIRVAVNFIKALSYSLEIPVLPVCSLELMAYSALKKYDSCFVINTAFRNLVYIAGYKKLINGDIEETLKPSALRFEELPNIIKTKSLVVGSAFEALNKHLDQTFIKLCLRDNSLPDQPKSSELSSRFSEPNRKFNFFKWNQLVPLYIRASEAEEKLRQSVLKPL
jgi:tRNA threonylcarbamoyladenosine biosynthesis protein TsaB